MKLVRCLLLTPVMTQITMAAATVREEFVARMDAAMAEKKRDSRLTKRLMQIAQPLEPQPRFLEQYQDLDVNMTEYALKYVGCQDVHQYSDELAQDDRSSTVLGMNRFVIVRLCPKDECSNYNRYGCNSGFGDYVIPMEDYLRTMAEEYFMEYQNYCETCYYCMVKASSQQGQQQQQQQEEQGDDAAQNNADDGAQAVGDDGAAGDDAVNGDDAIDGDDAVNGDDANARRRLATDDAYYYKNADFYNNMDNNNANANQGNDECANYYDACDDFRTACKDYSQYANNMEAYFECSEFNVGNEVGYLGPHCRSDGKTIGIGLYKDQYCNEYNSDITNLSSLMGMDLGDENLKAYYSQKCISCLSSDGYDLHQDGNNQVTAVCGALYEMSAKCNKYMGNAAESASSSQQKQNEASVCTFIHNLITNSYDEYGHIYLESGGWQAYIPDVRSMSKFQKYAMSFSILLVIGLFLYACYLHRKISKAKYAWYPKGRRGYSSRNFTGHQPILERMHSGIIQGRSRSGGTAELHEGGIFA